ncbi:hypothetical protein ACHAWO_006134 [Cyclotella atomus]|uniref:DUF3598 domain-containing protein n=1 Tax=Cyclotella atomus TaxID=382360 RepID=A0ABD3MTC0_9STRA
MTTVHSYRLLLASLAVAVLHHLPVGNAFAPVSFSQQPIASTRLHSTNQSPDAPKTPEEDAALQWDLFTRYHAVNGEWWGTWTSYDYMGDVTDTTVAGVSLQPNKDYSSVAHSQRILASSTQSDCNTCFSSSEVRTMPIATYDETNLGKRHRCAAAGMVVGPSLLPKSGLMSTELSLRHGDGRVRVTFQHAPVWERGVEPGSCPPQGLKLFRATVSKEKLRPCTPDDVSDIEGQIQGPPTAEEERSAPAGTPLFFRPVPPFKWHAKWAGTSWTWGPQTGDRGWAIEEIDEADSWHGRPMGDSSSVWSLRLPGGVLIQCPRVVVGGVSGLCRLAWMPEDDGEEGTITDGNNAKLLRVEASVMALEPIISEDDEDMMVGFYPPTLGSLRCDMLEKVGELEGSTLEERELKAEGFSEYDEVSESAVTEKTETIKPMAENVSQSKSPPMDDKMKEKIKADPRNALDL